jgi:hypothetical protein
MEWSDGEDMSTWIQTKCTEQNTSGKKGTEEDLKFLGSQFDRNLTLTHDLGPHTIIPNLDQTVEKARTSSERKLREAMDFFNLRDNENFCEETQNASPSTGGMAVVRQAGARTTTGSASKQYLGALGWHDLSQPIQAERSSPNRSEDQRHVRPKKKRTLWNMELDRQSVRHH